VAVAAATVGVAGAVTGPALALPSGGACHSTNGLPDHHCTPGALNPDVTQANIGTTICQSGYTAKIRPPTSYTNPLKFEEMQQYGLAGPPSDYELDHLVSLQLGGDPQSPKNLWPQAYAPVPGARQKDTVETTLKRQVCAGTRTLAEAQHLITTEWLKVWTEIQAAKASPSPQATAPAK
jgi:hypothetical protein